MTPAPYPGHSPQIDEITVGRNLAQRALEIQDGGRKGMQAENATKGYLAVTGLLIGSSKGAIGRGSLSGLRPLCLRYPSAGNVSLKRRARCG
jgi:hypothetical protein